MNHPLRLGLDIDGVIAEYRDIPPEDRTLATYDKLKPVSPEVMEAFADLADSYEVFLISSRQYRDAQEHTLLWLERHLCETYFWRARFELLTNVAPNEKWMIARALKLDYLVDDNPGVFRYGHGDETFKTVLIGTRCSPHADTTIPDLTKLLGLIVRAARDAAAVL